MIEELKGKILKEIQRSDINGNEKLTFICNDGDIFEMYHHQDCCESVSIDDIVGDLDDLIGNPITLAEEISEDDPEAYESGTWTFYKLATIKSYVNIKWYGTSNGYYSESVNFEKVN